jgi:hypothetical protein
MIALNEWLLARRQLARLSVRIWAMAVFPFVQLKGIVRPCSEHERNRLNDDITNSVRVAAGEISESARSISMRVSSSMSHCGFDLLQRIRWQLKTAPLGAASKHTVHLPDGPSARGRETSSLPDRLPTSIQHRTSSD